MTIPKLSLRPLRLCVKYLTPTTLCLGVFVTQHLRDFVLKSAAKWGRFLFLIYIGQCTGRWRGCFRRKGLPIYKGLLGRAEGPIGEGSKACWGSPKCLLGKAQRSIGEASSVYGGRLKGLWGKAQGSIGEETPLGMGRSNGLIGGIVGHVRGTFWGADGGKNRRAQPLCAFVALCLCVKKLRGSQRASANASAQRCEYTTLSPSSKHLKG